MDDAMEEEALAQREAAGLYFIQTKQIVIAQHNSSSSSKMLY
jgi:hypothetical protein